MHPTTVLRHRLLLHTTCYNHLRLLLHLLVSSKGKQKQQQARNPLSRRVEKPEGPSALQPTTEINKKFRLVRPLGISVFWVLPIWPPPKHEVILVLINFACKLRIRFATLFEKHLFIFTDNKGSHYIYADSGLRQLAIGRTFLEQMDKKKYKQIIKTKNKSKSRNC